MLFKKKSLTFWELILVKMIFFFKPQERKEKPTYLAPVRYNLYTDQNNAFFSYV